MGDPFNASPPFAGSQLPGGSAMAASPAIDSLMAAPPSSTHRAALPASASLRRRDEQLGPPSLTKRPKSTPAAACYVFGEASPMLPWALSSGKRASVISPFTNFAASLTPLYPSAVQAALPTPLAQLMHGSGPDRRELGGDSTAPKPRRSVTFSREQLSAAAELSSALGELNELAAGAFGAPATSERARGAGGSSQQPVGALCGQAAHTPFAEPGIADWARVDAPDSLGRVLSIQPTQRGLSPLSSELAELENAKNKQAVRTRRLQFEGEHGAMEQLHAGGSALAASTPLRTPVREADEPWLLMPSSMLGTPIACVSPSLHMLGTPNSLKEAFRLSEGEQGLSLGGRRHLPSLAGLSGSQHALPPGSEPHSAGAGSAGAKSKRDRSGGKENGKSKPRSCNCKNSKCIKLYCDCFSAGQFCLPSCKCDNCLNNADNEAARDEARKSILERNHHAFTSKVKLLQKEGSHSKGCNCKHSRCVKKYCECYQAGIACTEKCKCVDCANGKPSQPEQQEDARAAAGHAAPSAGGAQAHSELMLKLRAPAGGATKRAQLPLLSPLSVPLVPAKMATADELALAAAHVAAAADPPTPSTLLVGESPARHSLLISPPLPRMPQADGPSAAPQADGGSRHGSRGCAPAAHSAPQNPQPFAEALLRAASGVQSTARGGAEAALASADGGARQAGSAVASDKLGVNGPAPSACAAALGSHALGRSAAGSLGELAAATLPGTTAE